MNVLAFPIALLSIAMLVIVASFVIHETASAQLDAIAHAVLRFEEFVPVRLAALQRMWSLPVASTTRALKQWRAAGTQAFAKSGSGVCAGTAATEVESLLTH